MREQDEQSMVAAHKAGMAYWNRNKPENATRESLAVLARTCGWHGKDNECWLAGFYGAKRRATTNRV
jgi:hypothetical protein